MLRKSPFHARTSERCTSHNWQEWSGYYSADSYDLDHMREYNAVRTTAAVFDVSPLFKYQIRGRDAGRLLDRVVTRDVSKCRVGQVLYTVWCDDDGKILDDGTLARIGEDLYRLTAAIPTLDWLEDNALGLEVEIEDVTHELGALAIQGPTSRSLLQQLTDADLGSLGYFRLVDCELAGAPEASPPPQAASSSAAAATSTAARPTRLWKTAISWGRAVIWILTAMKVPMAPPTTMPARI